MYLTCIFDCIFDTYLWLYLHPKKDWGTESLWCTEVFCIKDQVQFFSEKLSWQSIEALIRIVQKYFHTCILLHMKCRLSQHIQLWIVQFVIDNLVDCWICVLQCCICVNNVVLNCSLLKQISPVNCPIPRKNNLSYFGMCKSFKASLVPFDIIAFDKT